MPRTVSALLRKFALQLGAAILVFYIFTPGNAWGWAIILTVVLTGLSYVAGDMILLPVFGPVIAAAADGAMAAIAAYSIDTLSVSFRSETATLTAFAALVAAAEYYFHLYQRCPGRP